MEYPTEYRKQLIQKILKPGGSSAMEISRETGIHHSTLYRWIKQENNGFMSREKGKTPRKFSLEQKYEFLLEAQEKTDEELGFWLREKGLQNDHLRKWEQEIANTLKGFNKSKEKELEHENKTLKKELTRKEKALAEMSALLVLKKNLPGDLERQ